MRKYLIKLSNHLTHTNTMIKQYKKETIELLRSTLKEIKESAKYSNINLLTLDDLLFIILYMDKYNRNNPSLRKLEKSTLHLIELLKSVNAISEEHIFELNIVLNMHNTRRFFNWCVVFVVAMIILCTGLGYSAQQIVETKTEQTQIMLIDMSYTQCESPYLILNTNGVFEYYFLQSQEEKNILTKVKKDDIVMTTKGRNIWGDWRVIEIKEVKND